MKTPDLICEEALLRDLDALAPMVREGFARMEGPSASVLQAIHEEAVAHAVRRAARPRFAFYVRFAAAAAVLVLLCGVSVKVWRTWYNERHQNQIVQILRITTQGTGAADHELADTTELASFLLSMQGLDRDTYFSSPDEMEALWL